MKIGRYEIKFGRYFWIQTHVPTTVRCLLGFIWIFREAKPGVWDKKPQFPPGTDMYYEGRYYRYLKVAKPFHRGK